MAKLIKLKKNDGSPDRISVCVDTWDNIQKLQENQPNKLKVKWILDEPKDKGTNKKTEK